MITRNVLAAAVLSLSAVSAQASTIFQPTDGDVNVFIDFGSLAGLADGYSLAMFDDSVTTALAMASADRLDISSNQIVGITGPAGSDFIATGTDPVDTLTLTGSNQFVLGITDGINWFMDAGTGSFNFGANTETLYFDTEASNSVFLGDVTVSAVPVPAAVWLFGAGLMGLVGVARRRA